MVVIPFNDIFAMERVLARHKQTLACVVIDPLAPRAGLVPVDSSYLSFLWEFAARHGILAISHEVPSFRLNLSFWTRYTQIALFGQVLSLSDRLGNHMIVPVSEMRVLVATPPIAVLFTHFSRCEWSSKATIFGLLVGFFGLATFLAIPQSPGFS
ncbi:hypothetical protein [Mesorhizobium sp. M0500]|uniref:hypothetical protein n=1 Tax=Mesorhizobium sp. M0500 TaxID=2956953 RepID=UPI00333B469A